jgi:hypothetical protein
MIDGEDMRFDIKDGKIKIMDMGKIRKLENKEIK